MSWMLFWKPSGLPPQSQAREETRLMSGRCAFWTGQALPALRSWGGQTLRFAASRASSLWWRRHSSPLTPCACSPVPHTTLSPPASRLCSSLVLPAPPPILTLFRALRRHAHSCVMRLGNQRGRLNPPIPNPANLGDYGKEDKRPKAPSPVLHQPSHVLGRVRRGLQVFRVRGACLRHDRLAQGGPCLCPPLRHLPDAPLPRAHGQAHQGEGPVRGRRQGQGRGVRRQGPQDPPLRVGGARRLPPAQQRGGRHR
mmetsp:Transcript_27070/g.65871  ORF Transcript_27070/g.65871 Transcript_27070/m.65871 type:complete len:254 (+) Transcript_27070:226-987(+)